MELGIKTEDTGQVSKHCLSLKTFIPNFLAFLVSSRVETSCIRKMSFSVTSAKREFIRELKQQRRERQRKRCKTMD